MSSFCIGSISWCCFVVTFFRSSSHVPLFRGISIVQTVFGLYVPPVFRCSASVPCAGVPGFIVCRLDVIFGWHSLTRMRSTDEIMPASSLSFFLSCSFCSGTGDCWRRLEYCCRQVARLIFENQYEELQNSAKSINHDANFTCKALVVKTFHFI